MKYALSVILGMVLGGGGAFWAMYEPPPPPEPAPTRDPNLVARVGELEIFVKDIEGALAKRRSDDKATVLDEIIGRLAVVARGNAEGVHEEYSVQWKLENVMIGEMKERELEPLLANLDVSDEQVRAEYESNHERYESGKKIRLAFMIQDYSEHWSEPKREAMMARMKGFRKRALSEPQVGKGFGALAVEATDFPPARYKGGDVGWFTEGVPSRWPQAVVDVGFGLTEPGAVSEILEAHGRLFVVKLMEVREGGVTPFEQVKDSLRHSLRIQAGKDASVAWWQAARDGVKVEIFEDALERVEVPERPGGENVAPPGFPP
jgi:peptidyl-prolyl cis-trans isomerase C